MTTNKPDMYNLMQQLGYGQDSKIEDGAAFLLHSGLLFQINRQILHPLGLALCVVKETFPGDRTEYSFAPQLLDCRLEEEGVTFNEEALKHGEAALLKFMEDFGMGKMMERQRSLGYVIQKTGDRVESEHI